MKSLPVSNRQLPEWDIPIQEPSPAVAAKIFSAVIMKVAVCCPETVNVEILNTPDLPCPVSESMCLS
jgi:hypothetical protein